MRRQPIDWLLGCGLLALVGCERPASPLAIALAAAEPHMTQFVDFEVWARRAHGTQAALGSRAALDETVFSRIRGDDQVVAAWIDVARRRPEHLALPVGTPPPERPVWQTVRTPAFGEVRVAVQRPCTISVASRAARPDAECVLIQRARATAPAEQLVVTVAYRSPPQ